VTVAFVALARRNGERAVRLLWAAEGREMKADEAVAFALSD
jgi:hypothetical protein